MATKKNETRAEGEGRVTDSQAASNQADAQQATGEGVRRGLGAPPPGTDGDPSVKAVDPGEPEAE